MAKRKIAKLIVGMIKMKGKKAYKFSKSHRWVGIKSAARKVQKLKKPLVKATLDGQLIRQAGTGKVMGKREYKRLLKTVKNKKYLNRRLGMWGITVKGIKL